MEAVKRVRISIDAQTYYQLSKLAERGGLEHALEHAIRMGMERYKKGIVSDVISDYSVVLQMASSYEADNVVLKALLDQNEKLTTKLQEAEGLV